MRNNLEQKQIDHVVNQENNAFYNQEVAQADMEYWCMHSTLSADELTALSFAKNPDVVNLQKINDYAKHLPFGKKYIKRFKLIHEAPIHKPHLNQHLSLISFIDWAEEIGLMLPLEMLERIREIKKRSEKNVKKTNESSTENMDEDSAFYSRELDMANIIHRTVTTQRDYSMTFKEQATSLINQDTSLSKEAKERLTVIVNPDKDKKGGRKPKNVK